MGIMGNDNPTHFLSFLAVQFNNLDSVHAFVDLVFVHAPVTFTNYGITFAA